MLTVHRIFEIYKLKPNKIRLVRHSNKEIPISKTFSENLKRLELYQSYQKPGKFGNAVSIAVFRSYYKTTALFLGLWDINGCLENSGFSKKIKDELKIYDLPEHWYNDSVKYSLKKNNILDELSERLVIEWGKSTVSWVQSKDKRVVEIKPKKSIGEFQTYDRISMDYIDLKKLTQFPDSNISWFTALSSVKGVYLIMDRTSGKLYVGSASGEGGIYARWEQYAKTGHGGNKELMALDPINFQFSILEIVSTTFTEEEVIKCENKWKEKLGTRKFGLNEN